MQSTESARFAFLGGGNMARALIAGLLRQSIPPDHISVGEPLADARRALERDLRVRTSADNIAAVGDADLVVLAVKPQEAAGALQALAGPRRGRRPLLLSIAAGLRIADLERASPPDTAVVRAMPNRAALVGAGITGLYAGAHVTAAERALAERVATATGRAVWLRTEAELDVVTAVSGSGPAYFFLLAEHMASSAEALGLAHETATELAAETLYGAGLLAHENAALAQQRAAVTSKGGTTEAALQVLHAGGFEALIGGALQAATLRSAELAEALSRALAPGRG